MNQLRTLQEENHNLKAELGQLKDELKQKDTLIATLESQLRSLILVNQQSASTSGTGGAGGAARSVISEGEESDNDEDTMSRMSSLGFASTMSPPTSHRGLVASAGRHTALDNAALLPPPYPTTSASATTSNSKYSVTSNKQQQVEKNSSVESYDEERDTIASNEAVTGSSPATKSSGSNSKKNDLPAQQQKQGKQTLQTIAGTSMSKECHGKDDDDNDDHRPTYNAIRTSKGAIKALPRELSIYNSNDDDVTKYSIDDGKPTYVIDTPIAFRDAYNVRGLYNGSVNRAHQLPHGVGKMKYNIGGSIYEGEWSLGHWHGTGKVIDGKHGNVYEGQFVNDLKHGQGKEVYADGRVFEGTFSEGDAVDGTMCFPNGSKYVGQLREGERNGYGVYYFEDGSVYEGESKNNLFEGQGKVTWPDGGWYEGEWKNGTMEGRGKEIRPDGSLRHEGMWTNGAPIRE
jgi:hypothetical protein